MKVVFHERFREVYARDAAAAPGRLDLAVEELRRHFSFVEPAPAAVGDVARVHTTAHIEAVKRRGLTYEMALLAAGGAIAAAELALAGEKAFGLIRPPGHHASPNSSWGFCWFNNVAVAVEKLRYRGDIRTALIVDIDLHFGDGTAAIFGRVPEVAYYHVSAQSRREFLSELEEFLGTQGSYDLVALSAGFDRHVADWGGTLYTEDYELIGRMMADFAAARASGRLFAVLEGGYDRAALAEAACALLEGME